MKKIILLISTLIFSLNISAAIVVIGNTAGVNELSQKNAKKLFMGKKTKLANGEKAQIVELVAGDAKRITFHETVTGRSEAQLQSAWARLVFTGRAEAPIEVADDAAMIKAVSTATNAIGYVDESSLTRDVKVLLKL